MTQEKDTQALPAGITASQKYCTSDGKEHDTLAAAKSAQEIINLYPEIDKYLASWLDDKSLIAWSRTRNTIVRWELWRIAQAADQ